MGIAQCLICRPSEAEGSAFSPARNKSRFLAALVMTIPKVKFSRRHLNASGSGVCSRGATASSTNAANSRLSSTGSHDRVRTHNSHAAHLRRFNFVGAIDHQHIEKILVGLSRLPQSCSASPSSSSALPPGPIPPLPRQSDSPQRSVAFVRRNASRTPGTARIGPMLVTGLLGANTIASADSMLSITPGAGRALSAPSKRTACTST